MSSLVEQLQIAARDPSVSVSALLRMAATVSSKLGVGEIDDWIRRERNGYGDTQDLPHYRRLRGELKVRNPYHGLQSVFGFDEKMLDLVTQANVGQRISEIEHIVQGDGTIHYPLPPKFVASLMEAMQVPLEPLLVIQRASMAGILDGVRDAVLDWSLALERNGVVGTAMSFSTPEKAAAAQATYTTINHIGAMTNSQLQQHSIKSTQTIEHKVDIEGLAALVEAISGAIEREALPEDQRSELAAELGTLRAQAASPKPKIGIIAESLATVRRILEGAAGHVLATYGPQVAAILNTIPH